MLYDRNLVQPDFFSNEREDFFLQQGIVLRERRGGEVNFEAIDDSIRYFYTQFPLLQRALEREHLRRSHKG